MVSPLTVTVDTKATATSSAYDGTLYLRVTPNDSLQDGTAVTSSFSLDNAGPANLSTATAEASGTSVTVSWDNTVSDTNFDRYEIWYGTSSTEVMNRTGSATRWTTSSDSNLQFATTTQTTITSLDPGSYSLMVLAFDDYGNYSTSSIDTAAVLGDVPIATSPSSITQLTDGSGYVTFGATFDDADTDNIYSKIEFSTNTTNWFSAYIVTTTNSVGASSITINNAQERQLFFERSTMVSSPPISDGAVLWYPFEDSSATIDDISSNNISGTYANGSLYRQSGHIGYALGFDGNDDLLTVTNQAAIRPTKASFGGWFKIDGVGSDADGVTLIRKGRGSSGSDYDSYSLFYNPTSDLLACDYNVAGTDRVVYSVTTVNESTGWFHVYCTFDNSTIKVYVNGSLNNSASYSGVITYNTYTYNDLYFGRWAPHSTLKRSFDGFMDDVSLYNRDLTASEVLELYQYAGSVSTSTVDVVWDTKYTSSDIAEYDGTVYLRVTPNDSLQDGTAVTSSFSLDNAGPANLTTATAEASGSSVTVSWDDNVSDTNFDRYEIWYGTSSTEVMNRTGSATRWTTSSDSNLQFVTTTQTTITSLDPGDYSVMVFAFDDYGNYSTSSVDTATVLGNVPTATAPASITQATDGSGYVSFVTDVIDTDTANLRFKVQHSLNGGSTWLDSHISSISQTSGTSTVSNDVAYPIIFDQEVRSLLPLILMHGEDSSGTISDTIGNYNGTYTGTLYSQTGKFNNAVGFDGNDDVINFGNVTEINSTSAFTIMGWYKQSVIDSYDWLFLKNSALATPFIGVRTYTDGNMYSYIYGSSNGYNAMDYSQYVTAGQWFHYAMVYDGTQGTACNRLKIYINGTSRGSCVGTYPATTPDLSAYDLTVSNPVAAWAGSVDEFAVFGSALSAVDIASIYDAEISSATYSTSSLTIVWDSLSTSNEGGAVNLDQDVLIRVTPSDSLQDGTSVTSSFALDNTGPANLTPTMR